MDNKNGIAGILGDLPYTKDNPFVATVDNATLAKIAVLVIAAIVFSAFVSKWLK